MLLNLTLQLTFFFHWLEWHYCHLLHTKAKLYLKNSIHCKKFRFESGFKPTQYTIIMILITSSNEISRLLHYRYQNYKTALNQNLTLNFISCIWKRINFVQITYNMLHKNGFFISPFSSMKSKVKNNNWKRYNS